MTKEELGFINSFDGGDFFLQRKMYKTGRKDIQNPSDEV